MAFEVFRAIEFLALLGVLIWCKDRLIHQGRFRIAVVLFCVSYVLPAIVILFGDNWNPAVGPTGVIRIGALTGGVVGVSLFFLFFSLLDDPWERKKPVASDRKPRPRTAAKKATTRKKKKTSG